MTFIFKAFLLLLVCVLLKFEYNFRRYNMIIKIKGKYLKWIEDEDSVSDMLTYQSTIRELFNKAKVKDTCFPTTQYIGYGKVASSSCSVFANLLYRDPQIIASVLDMFDEAIGFYRSGFKSAFNPLCWIETIVFLPKSVMEYIDIDTEKSSAKIINVIMTGLWWLICLFCTCFKTEIIQLIQTFLQKLAQP